VHPKEEDSAKVVISAHIYLIFLINYIIGYIDKEMTQSLMIKELRIPGLLFADDLAVASFTSYGLQKKI
jgi:hypothetical protein